MRIVRARLHSERAETVHAILPGRAGGMLFAGAVDRSDAVVAEADKTDRAVGGGVAPR